MLPFCVNLAPQRAEWVFIASLPQPGGPNDLFKPYSRCTDTLIGDEVAQPQFPFIPWGTPQSLPRLQEGHRLAWRVQVLSSSLHIAWITRRQAEATCRSSRGELWGR